MIHFSSSENWFRRTKVIEYQNGNHYKFINYPNTRINRNKDIVKLATHKQVKISTLTTQDDDN